MASEASPLRVAFSALALARRLPCSSGAGTAASGALTDCWRTDMHECSAQAGSSQVPIGAHCRGNLIAASQRGAGESQQTSALRRGAFAGRPNQVEGERASGECEGVGLWRASRSPSAMMSAHASIARALLPASSGPRVAILQISTCQPRSETRPQIWESRHRLVQQPTCTCRA